MGSTQPNEPRVRQRVRIRFGKQGDLRLIGHRDLARLMERLFRRAGLRLGMSEGFHPKPRISFPSALAVGIEGLDELMELELAQASTAEELLPRLSARAVPGLNFQSVEVLPEGPKKQKAQIARLTYQMPIPVERRAEVARRVEELLARPSQPVSRPHRSTPIDLREFLEALTLSEGVLSMRFRVTRQAGPGPRDLLAALELSDLERQGARLRRTAVETQP